MRRRSTSGRFAERWITGVDHGGAEERVVVCFEGHELDDALEQANSVLEDDLRVSEDDGRAQHVRPFTRNELLGPLERWFFGRGPTR